jgi:hypothetical protein
MFLIISIGLNIWQAIMIARIAGSFRQKKDSEPKITNTRLAWHLHSDEAADQTARIILDKWRREGVI